MHTTIEADSLTTPATPMQESVWWVHQRARNKSVYNLTWRLICHRALDVGALRTAWQSVVDRHDALRTSVVRSQDTVQLVVRSHVPGDFGLVEVDDPGTVDVDTMFRLIAEEVQERVVPLDSSSLARVTVVRVGERYELLFTVHHVVLDGWGVQVLLGELSAAYASALLGEPPPFDHDPMPFHVYADELRAEREAGRWQRSLDYWCTALDGARAVTLVPDRPATGAVGEAGVTVRYAFSEQASAGVATLSKAVFATPFAAVLGALQIVLARGGGGPDVTVGVVVANRMSVAEQALVGYTANLCISRGTVEAEDTIADVVARAREGMWTMLAHQRVPYPVVFNALSDATRASLSDAAPILLSFLGSIGTDLRLGSVEMTLARSPNRAARTDFAMSFWEADGGYVAEIEFNTARYGEASIRALLLDVDAILSVGATEPSRPVSSLEVRTRSVARRPEPLLQASPTVTTVQPRSDSWEQVVATWTDILDRPPRTEDESFFDAGGHSLDVVRLVARLESATGVDIDVVDWLSVPSPRRLVAVITGGRGRPEEGSTTTLTVLRDGPGPQLHLVHGAGGGGQDYRHLLAALPSHWRITCSEEREALTTVPAMAERYRQDLDAGGLRPDLLGGWSMGGQVAYEMCLGYGPPYPGLVLLDSAPPVGYDAQPEPERFAAFVANLCRSLGVELDCSVPRVLGEVELATNAVAAYLTCGGQSIPATVLADRWLTYDRHGQATASYVQRATVEAPTLVVAADLLDPQVDEWVSRVGGRKELLRIGTDHHGLLLPGAAREVASAIEKLQHHVEVST